MLKIYGVYRSRAIRNIWMALELGIPFEHHPIIPAYRIEYFGIPNTLPHSMSDEFLKINPNGTVPAVIDGDLTLTQSLAANLYLAKKHGGPLAPKDLIEDAKMLMWTLWAAADVEQFTGDILHHRMTYPEHKKQTQIADLAVEKLRRPFAVLNDALTQTGWIVGERFTAVDLNVAAVIHLAAAAPELFANAPHVKSWLMKCHARPAYQEVIRQRDAQPDWTK